MKDAVSLAEGILGLTFVNPTGEALPRWTPGSHIDVVLPSGSIRSYSLCGDPGNVHEYRIAVLLEKAGRGGSAEIHATPLVGRRLEVSAPKNAFPLVDATHYLFVAGGIGITPLLPMIREIASRDGSWRGYYLGRSRGSMAFLDQLVALSAPSLGRLDVIVRNEGRRFDVDAVIAAAPCATALYCCGPERLLSDVQRFCQTPAGARCSLHLERFGRPNLAAALEPSARPGAGDPDDYAECDPDGPFEVRLAQSGVTLQVPPGGSILQVVRSVRRDLTYSCSSGYCGTCETRVLGGSPDHRDEVLTEAERATNQSMMICVGRSRTRTLVLDL